MNSLVIFAAFLAVANAGLTHTIIAPIAHGTTLQGPGTKTLLSGPDGSHISAAAPGGIVSTASHSAAVVAAPVLAHAAPVVAAPAIIARAPVVAHAASLGVVAHTAPVIAPIRVHPVDPAFVAHGPHGALIAPGTGIGGQYQHDYTETLYDDGQYKGEVYHALAHH